jgi:hypothetical protein
MVVGGWMVREYKNIFEVVAIFVRGAQKACAALGETTVRSADVVWIRGVEGGFVVAGRSSIRDAGKNQSSSLSRAIPQRPTNARGG